MAFRRLVKSFPSEPEELRKQKDWEGDIVLNVDDKATQGSLLDAWKWWEV